MVPSNVSMMEMDKPKCPACGSADRVTKNGFTHGRQRWVCGNTMEHKGLHSFTVGPPRKRGPGKKPKKKTRIVRVELDERTLVALERIDGGSRSEKLRNAIMSFSGC